MLVATVGCLATGCVSTSQVGTFSQAAGQAITQVGNGFNEVQETTITRKLSDVASDTAAPKEASFEGLLDMKTELAPRLDCLNQIKNYADSLGNLANANYRTQIDAASANLYGSLNGLAKTYQKATSQKLPGSITDDTAIIATAIDAIGNSIVEYKRQAALRKIILKIDPTIQTVCADLEKTFNELDQDRFIYMNLNSQVADMTGYYNQQTVKWNYEQRFGYLNNIRQARLTRDGSEVFVAAAIKSISALAKAHHALADSARHGKLSSSDIAQAIGELSDEANKAKQFYDTIHGKN